MSFFIILTIGVIPVLCGNVGADYCPAAKVPKQEIFMYSVTFPSKQPDLVKFTCPGCPSWIDAYISLNFQIDMMTPVMRETLGTSVETVGIIQLFPDRGELLELSTGEFPSPVERDTEVLKKLGININLSEEMAFHLEKNLTEAVFSCVGSRFGANAPCPPKGMKLKLKGLREGYNFHHKVLHVDKVKETYLYEIKKWGDFSATRKSLFHIDGDWNMVQQRLLTLNGQRKKVCTCQSENMLMYAFKRMDSACVWDHVSPEFIPLFENVYQCYGEWSKYLGMTHFHL